MILRQSDVIFDELNHRYFRGEEEFSGITPIIGKYICPNKYDGIDPIIMSKARERGATVHNQLEELFLFNEIISGKEREEIKAYRKLVDERGLQQVASEYLVDSPLYGVASKIDLVFQVSANVVDIADAKTTCNLDKTYLSYQLSIYAYLFAKNNPRIYVRNLYGVHLKGDTAKLVEVKRIPDFVIEQLLFTNLLGLEKFDNPMNL